MPRLLLVVLLAAAGLAALAAPAAATPGDLFVLHAGHGTLKPGGSAGRFGLTLRDTGAVTSFTDRPRRRAGEQPLRRLVHRWRALGFTADPPNAALVDSGAPKGRDVVVVTLTRPKLLAGGHAVRFRAHRIKAADGALGRFDKRADARLAARFAGASLFIDDAPAQPVQIFWSVDGLPAGGDLLLRFSGATLTEAAMQGQVQAGSITGFIITSRQIGLTAGPIGLTTPFFTDVVPNGSRIAGTASFPTGTTVTAIPPTGPTVAIHSGPFSLPAGSG